MRHATEEQLVLHHYGDLEDTEEADLSMHLASCAACRGRLAALERELRSVRPLPVPDRPADYGSSVWERLQPRLAEVRPPSRERWWRRLAGPSTIRPLVYAGGVAVLVLAAFVAGRYWAPGPGRFQDGGASQDGQAARLDTAIPATGRADTTLGQPPERPSAERVRERILVLEVGEHLERSRAALLEVVNAPDEEGGVDLSGDRERARELVAENRLYRLTAVDAGENGMAEVLDELERVLLEVANSPSHVSGTEFERVRGEIDAQGLLFKVGVLGDSLRQRQVSAVRSST